MHFNDNNLSGLDIVEKDGLVHVVQVTPKSLSTDFMSQLNGVLVSMQNSNYEIINVSVAMNSALVFVAHITYR